MRLTCQERQERRSVSAAGVAGNGRAATLLLLHRLARDALWSDGSAALAWLSVRGTRRSAPSCDSVSEYYPIFPTSTSRLVGTYYNNGKQKNPIPRVPRGSPRYRGPLGQYDRKQHFIVSESLPARAQQPSRILSV